jgi:hypothetical protein
MSGHDVPILIAVLALVIAWAAVVYGGVLLRRGRRP